MAGLDPAIRASEQTLASVDARIKSGHDKKGMRIITNI
jgi:hypothetical protein